MPDTADANFDPITAGISSLMAASLPQILIARHSPPALSPLFKPYAYITVELKVMSRFKPAALRESR
jgi:hypothetical protein